MKILIAYAHQDDLSVFRNHVKCKDGLASFNYKHIQLYFVQTGYTVYETAFAMGQALADTRYHLIVFAGFANSLNKRMKTGDVLNVINDIPFAIGRKDREGFENAYILGWLNKSEKPHVRGGYINLTSSYFNVFLPFMKTAAITAPTLEGDDALISLKQSSFPLHIESSNGIGFHYACLSKNMPFYQLRAIKYNVEDKVRNQELAKKELNKALIQIIDLL